MNEPYSILFQKSANTSVVDSADKWGIVCTSIPFVLDGGVKDLASRDWPGESGDDVFIPKTLPLKPYDFEVEMAYKGAVGTAFGKISDFRNYLSGRDGNGAELKIYNSRTKIGRKDCYWVSMSGFQHIVCGVEEVVTFKTKFRVNDPVTALAPTILTIGEKTSTKLAEVYYVGD